MVLGCAHGLGRSVALGCAQAGAEVLLADHHPEPPGVLTEITGTGGRASFAHVDVESVPSLRSNLLELVGDSPLHGLIYFPRARLRKAMEEVAEADWDRDLDVSLRGAFFAVQTLLPALRRSAPGFVITLSSILSESVGVEGVGYHVAKAGLDQLTRYLAVHLGPHRIRVNAVQIGWMVKDEHLPRFLGPANQSFRAKVERIHPLRMVGESVDLMNVISFLGSDASRFMTGQILRLDGGLTLQEQSHLVDSLKAEETHS